MPLKMVSYFCNCQADIFKMYIPMNHYNEYIDKHKMAKVETL